MRAIFTGSSTSTATASSDSANASPRSLTKRASTSQLSQSPTTPAVSVSSPDDPFPRRIKSKSSLRSIGSSHADEDDESTDQSGLDKTLVRPSILRRLSPGLAARVKLLDGSYKTSTTSRNANVVGRIPQEHLKELDSLHQQNRSIRVEKRGRAWIGLPGNNHNGRREQSVPSRLEVPELEPEYEPYEEAPERQSEVVTEPLSPSAPSSPDRTVAETTLDPEPAASQVEGTNDAAAAMSVVEPAPVPAHPEPDLEPNSAASQEEQTDFEKYIQSTTEDAENPPPPPPKDSPPAHSRTSSTDQSYFSPMGLHRTESIYSFSRASFSNQLSQLTSITLPQPSSLEASIAGISNAPAAVKALTGASEQIMIWIRKASDVLSGLDAEDDVEWAAAGGREGLDGVDKAITRFESLVNVYVKAIEDVQLRPDIGNVGPDSLTAIVFQMESILKSWAQIKSKLRGVKGQVELAMEWEELWSNVLGDVGMEVDNLGRLIFEMEEKRHRTMTAEVESSGGLDINELETIIEETPSNGNMHASHRLSMGPIFDAAPTMDTPIIQTPQEDTNYSDLMALFARMQPLRASLDFLPMRLSMFQSRAEGIFPSACEELEDKRSKLEASYKTLQADAEALRKELSEDRWILVFRNAGSQAQKMFESVERSIGKLQESLETGAHIHNAAGFTKRMENYEAKKLHYVPAIERVTLIIQKGLNDRLTVNGEILRLLSDMQSRTDALKASIKVMDSSLEEINFVKTQQLRDSISSIITMDSPLTGSAVDTPGSSPASSVIMTSGGMKGSSTPLGSSSRRGSSVGSTARTTLSKIRRYSGIPQATAPLTGRKSSIPKPVSGLASPSPTKMNPAFMQTPAGRKPVRPPPPSPLNNKPRWNMSTNTNDLEVGHTYKPSYTTPSYRKSSAPSRLTSRPSSTIPPPSPLSRDQSVSPAPGTLRSASRVSSRLTSRSLGPNASPTPSRSILDPPPYSKLRKQPTVVGIANTPRSRQSFAGVSVSRSAISEEDSGLASPRKSTRPGTSLGHSGNRRISLLPLPKTKTEKDSSAGNRSKLDNRPPWR